jgi:hypothetical protein
MGILAPVHSWFGYGVVAGRFGRFPPRVPRCVWTSTRKRRYLIGLLQKPRPRMRAKWIKPQGLAFGLNSSICCCFLHLETEIGWSTVAPVVCPEKALRFVSLVNQTMVDQPLFCGSRPRPNHMGRLKPWTSQTHTHRRTSRALLASVLPQPSKIDPEP